MNIREIQPSGPLTEELLVLSADWESENSCRGYRRNTREDLEGTRVFIAEENDELIGYLFGRQKRANSASSVMPAGAVCFEVEELYVKPAFRSRGVGAALFRYMEELVEADYLTLSTATKDFQAVLHFYIDLLGMDFWSARLVKKR